MRVHGGGMWLLGLVGCWWAWPEASDEHGFLGRVTDATGTPVVGLKVENLESSERTDAEGVFGLYYKAPDLFVAFNKDGGYYRRTYRPEDENTRIEIELPEVRRGELKCGDFECRAQLTWALSPGFSVKHHVACKVGEAIAIEGLPPGLPEVTCRTKVTEPEIPLSISRTADSLVLSPPKRLVKVQMEIDGGQGEPCEVWSGESAGLATEYGFSMDLVGGATIQGRCGGRAATPAVIGPDNLKARVFWSAEGPSLQKPPGMELERLQLKGKAWTLEAKAGKDGVFYLPPLPAGRYTVQLYNTAAGAVPEVTDGSLDPGVVRGQLLASGVYAGELQLDVAMASGVLTLR